MEKESKVYFIQRLGAYLIDAILISFIAVLISMPLMNNSVEKLSAKSSEIMESYLKQEIDANTYMHQSIDISYQMARQNCLSTIATIVVEILYFMVLQFYLGGQTLGKRLLKIKIVKQDGSDLSMNDVVIRNLINNSIFADIVVAIMILFNKNVYFYGSSIVQIIQYIIIFVSIFMIIVRKDGRSVSDLIAGTKVVKVKE